MAAAAAAAVPSAMAASMFDVVLREVSARLLAAHSAALSQLEGELQQMRRDNTVLRMRLAEAGLSTTVAAAEVGCAQVTQAPTDKPLRGTVTQTPGTSEQTSVSRPVVCPVSIPVQSVPSACSVPAGVASSPVSFSPGDSRTADPERSASASTPEPPVTPQPTPQRSPEQPQEEVVRGSSEAVPPCHPLQVGNVVRIHSLKAAQELNGLQAVCTQLDESSGRWIVRLPCGAEKALRGENLEFVAAKLPEGPAVTPAPGSVVQDEPALDAAPLPAPTASRPVPTPPSEKAGQEAQRAMPKAATATTPQGVPQAARASPVAASPPPAATAGGAVPSRPAQPTKAQLQDQQLEALLRRTLQQLGISLEVRNCGHGEFLLAGVSVRLQAHGEPGKQRLLASGDEGKTWEVFEVLFQQHAQQQGAQAGGAGTPEHRSQTASPSANPGNEVPPSRSTRSAPVRAAALCSCGALIPPDKPFCEKCGQRNLLAAPPSRSPTSAGDHAGGSPYSAHTPTRQPHSTQQTQQAPNLGPIPLVPEPQGEELPQYRSDGMPAFNEAFPTAFDAYGGSAQYYSQFRVRVPTDSQYESFGSHAEFEAQMHR
eukprot:TRINITY_DN56823_c0_g1_i2.p1 TRINITY_DN56823_c0_g1~~TRINITY_DN56823_c0_g1_i2.p1  ORF type:complete len:596 (-),score=103.25 TRINITY_DN56823_c0_g1_i2:12-1799(-)